MRICFFILGFVQFQIPSLALKLQEAGATEESVLSARVPDSRKCHPGAFYDDFRLEQLLDYHGSDKGHKKHQYYKLYSLLTTPSRHVESMVEIGIGTQALMGYPPGASLRSWRDLLPESLVFGLDIDPKANIEGESRIITLTGIDTTDASSGQIVENELIQATGKRTVDIIIDDGAHDPVLQGKTLHALFDKVRQGGLYVIEDLLWKHGKKEEGHHFCNMEFYNPFVFGTGVGRDAGDGLGVVPDSVNYTSPELQYIEDQGYPMFYATMHEFNSESNMLVISKGASNLSSPFVQLPGNYHSVYNILLPGLNARRVIAMLPNQFDVWRGALPSATVTQSFDDGCDIDIIVSSMKGNVHQQALGNLEKLSRGGFLFIEDAQFSFCEDSSLTLFGADRPKILDHDWFWAMTQNDKTEAAASGKLLVLRKK